MNAVDEFLEFKAQGMEKEAAGTRALGSMASLLGAKPGEIAMGAAALGAGAVIAGTIAQAGDDIYEAAKKAITRARGFNRMLKENPELGEMDRKKVHATFRTLHNFNPEMAADPYVSGSWVKSLAEYDNVPTKTISDLISARSKTGPRSSPMERGMPIMVGAMGGARSMEEGRQKREDTLGLESEKQTNKYRLEQYKRHHLEGDAMAKQVGNIRGDTLAKQEMGPEIAGLTAAPKVDKPGGTPGGFAQIGRFGR